MYKGKIRNVNYLSYIYFVVLVKRSNRIHNTESEQTSTDSYSFAQQIPMSLVFSSIGARIQIDSTHLP